MPDKKRTNFGKKGDDPSGESRKLPQINVDEEAVAGDAGASGKVPGIRTAKLKKVDPDKRSQSTRINLPEEMKGKKIDVENLPTDEIPKADQIEQAAKTATTRIEIDTEAVTPAGTSQLNITDEIGHDKTMQINTTELEVVDDPGGTSKIPTEDIKPSAATLPIDTNAVDGSADQTLNIDDLGDDSDKTLNIDDLSDAAGTVNLDALTAETQKVGAADDLAAATLQMDESALQDAIDQDNFQNAATMQIDADQLESSDTAPVDAADAMAAATMQIDPNALDTESADSGNLEDVQKSATMQIDPNALQTGDVPRVSRELLAAENNASTMQIDPDSLAPQADADKKAMNAATAPLSVGDSDDELADKTMQIDPDALGVATNVNIPVDGSDSTMQIDPTELADNSATTQIPLSAASEMTQEIPSDALDDDPTFSQQTISMDPRELDAAAKAIESTGTDYSSQTIAMDPLSFDSQALNDAAQTQEAIAPPGIPGAAPVDHTVDMAGVDDDPDRPKTIMIKRPSREPSAPKTVKTVKPDAQTVRTKRPPRNQTERVQTSASEPAASPTPDGKTVKLRRPGGGTARPSVSTVSRAAGAAGMSYDPNSGALQSNNKPKGPELGFFSGFMSLLSVFAVGAAVYLLAGLMAPEDIPLPNRIVNPENGGVVPLDGFSHGVIQPDMQGIATQPGSETNELTPELDDKTGLPLY